MQLINAAIRLTHFAHQFPARAWHNSISIFHLPMAPAIFAHQTNCSINEGRMRSHETLI